MKRRYNLKRDRKYKKKPVRKIFKINKKKKTTNGHLNKKKEKRKKIMIQYYMITSFSLKKGMMRFLFDTYSIIFKPPHGNKKKLPSLLMPVFFFLEIILSKRK